MNLTFEKALNEYFEYSKMQLKKTTYEEQTRKIKKYILPYFKDKYIFELNIKDIISWKEYINSFNFSYNYKSYIYYSLTSIFDFLMKYYGINKNLARIEGNFKNNSIKHKGNIWSLEEFNQFINVVDDKKYNILFRLLYFSGMRKGEVLALTWEDIDFSNSTININKTISRNHELLPPKTFSSNRTIYINKNIIQDLIELKKQSNDNYIFNISFTQLKRKKDYYCNLSGVKQIKIHEFRHSHACYLFQNKIEIEEISYRLGHSNISMTMSVYLNYLPRDEKRVIRLLNSI